jgi:hypothetical protein
MAARNKSPSAILYRNSETDLSDTVARALKAKSRRQGDGQTGGFAANPKSVSEPLAGGYSRLADRALTRSHLKIHLTQVNSISSKPALVKNARLYASGDTRWSELSSDRNYHNDLAKLTGLEKKPGKNAGR